MAIYQERTTLFIFDYDAMIGVVAWHRLGRGLDETRSFQRFIQRLSFQATQSSGSGIERGIGRRIQSSQSGLLEPRSIGYERRIVTGRFVKIFERALFARRLSFRNGYTDVDWSPG